MESEIYVQPKRRLECLDGNKNRVNVVHILSSDDPPMPSTSVTEAYTMELEAKVSKLKEQNQELKRKAEILSYVQCKQTTFFFPIQIG